jgi:hypothetical protein
MENRREGEIKFSAPIREDRNAEQRRREWRSREAKKGEAE